MTAVRVEQVTREWAEALAEGDAVFTERFGIPVEPGWFGFSRQRRGIATAAVRTFIDQAKSAGLQVVVAHTLPRESPSTSVLKHCGFRQVGESIDPDEGEVWRWELPLRPVQPSTVR